jgi:hypothetical protein
MAAIQRKVPDNPVPPSPAPEPESAGYRAPLRQPRTPRPQPKDKIMARRGSGSQFWLHDEDRRLLRELAAWLAGQGVRTTDSLVVRAALRAVQTGHVFLEAYKQAAQLDGRSMSRKSQSDETGETV